MFTPLKNSLRKVVTIFSNTSIRNTKSSKDLNNGSVRNIMNAVQLPTADQALTSIMHLAVSRLKFVLAMTLAFVLVACAPSGGSSSSDDPAGPGTGTVSAFSHDGYTFAANIAGDVEVPLAPTRVGRVFPNRAAIANLVAAAAKNVGRTDIRYTLSYSLTDTDVSSPVNTYFSVSETNGTIYVANPSGGGLTFDTIRGLLDKNTLSITMTITDNDDTVDFSEFTRKVNVVILNSAEGVNSASLSYNRAMVSAAGTAERREPGGIIPVLYTGANRTGTIVSGNSLNEDGTLEIISLFARGDLNPGSNATDLAGGNPVTITPEQINAQVLNATHILVPLTLTYSYNDGTEEKTVSFPIAADTAIATVDGNRSVPGSITNHILTNNAELFSDTNTLAFALTWTIPFTYMRDVQSPEVVIKAVPGRANFATAGSIDENNALNAELEFARLNNPAATTKNPVSAFAISRVRAANAAKDAPQVTLFYAVVDNSTTGAVPDTTCGNGAVYLDNNDMRLKAGARFNHEDTGVYNCRLVVSTDGENYNPLAFVVSSGDAAGPKVVGATEFTQVSQSDNQTANCADSTCYYGDITITVTDENERPTITLSADTFQAIPEGPGVAAAFVTVAGDPITPVSVNDDNNTVTITIEDPDNGQDAGTPTISVTPASGDGAFDIIAGENANEYKLTILDASKLNYEGDREYTITITSTDGAATSKLDPRTLSTTIALTDVQYNPVFVDANNLPLTPATAFIKEANIANGTNGSPLYLLSGLRALQRHSIATIRAVDPESGSAAGITYSITGATPVGDISAQPAQIQQALGGAATLIGSNLQLVNIANGARLIVAGTNIPAGATGQPAPSATISVTATKGTATNAGTVNLEVDGSQYPNTGLLLGNVANTTRVPVSFNSQIPVVGAINEAATAGANATFIDAATQLDRDSNELSSFATIAAADTTPYFDFLDIQTGPFATVAGDVFEDLLADIRTLNINLAAGVELFDIDSTTGRISIKEGMADQITFPAVYSLPVAVANATTSAEYGAAITDIAFDLTIATIVVTDNNTPPTLVGANPAAVEVKEGVPSLATATDPRAVPPIVTFTITDDNNLYQAGSVDPFVAPLFTVTSTAPAFVQQLIRANVVPVLGGTAGNQRVTGYTVNVVPAQPLNYENPTHQAALSGGEINLTITDGGAFELDPATRMVNPTTAEDDATSAVITLRITLTDVAEPVVLNAVTEPAPSISESATGLTDIMVATVGNPGDYPDSEGVFDPSRITLTLTNVGTSPGFAGILNPVFSATTPGAIVLNVTDAARLENLGDGRTFPATITARAGTADPVSVVVNIQIENDPANSNVARDIIQDALNELAISEQTVAGTDGVYAVPGFSLTLGQLVRDADETIVGTDMPLSSGLGLSVSDVTVSNSLRPTLNTTNLLSVQENAGVFTLELADADFVESDLFGDIRFTLTPTAGGASEASVADFAGTITINQADPKNIAYTTPVNAITYTQSAYADEANLTTIGASPVATIDGDTAFAGIDTIAGVTGEFINITDENTAGAYPTITLGEDGARFVARTNEEATSFSGGALSADGRFAILAITDEDGNPVTNLPADATSFDILSPDATTGNLEDASAEFNRYFTLSSNPTGSSINITQKTFAYAYTNASGQPDTGQYNALDTIQLYAGAEEGYTFNYFIRAKAAENSANNASNFALAQFSVAVGAAGLNARTEIIQIALVPKSASYRNFALALPANSANLTSGTDTIEENEFAVNSFDDYELVVEFRNPDALTSEEGESVISVSIDEGTIDARGDREINTASNGELIALRSPGDTTTAAPAANAPVADANSPNFSDAGVTSTNYIRTYDFALAKNLAGTAQFTISVQDRDSDDANLGSPSSDTYTLTVTPATDFENSDVTVASSAGTGANEVDNIHDGLTEDTGPLATAGVVTIAPSATIGANEPLGATSVTTLTGITGDGGNPRTKEFLTDATATGFTYVEHGNGEHNFNYNVVVTEPRGFGDTTVVYPAIAVNDVTVTVAEQDDPTTVSASSLDGFVSDEYPDAEADFNGEEERSKTGQSVTFQDNDLLFDTVANVLGAVTVTQSSISNTIAGDPALVFSNEGTLNDDGTAFASISIGYTLPLTGGEWTLLRQNSPTNFNLQFAFDGAKAAGTPLVDAAEVSFTVTRTTATLTTAHEDATINENHDGVLTGSGSVIVIADADVDIPTDTDVSGGYTFTITSSARDTSTGAPAANAEDFLSPGSITRSGAGTANAVFNVDAANLDDAQVGTYTIEWSIVDNQAATGATDEQRNLTGSFTLTVTGVAEDSSDLTIAFTGAGPININTEDGDNFPIRATVSDPDLNDPTISPTIEATGGAITFTFSGGTDGTSPNCEVSVADLFADGTELTGSGTRRSVDDNLGAVTLQNVLTACGTNTPLIGSRINAASVAAPFNVKVPEDSTDATALTPILSGFTGYTLQGFRTVAPTMTLDTTRTSITPESSRDITVTLTDGDIDDGYFGSAANDNHVRADGTEWQSTGVLSFSGCGLDDADTTNDAVTPTPGALTASGNNDGIATITLTVTAAASPGESCVLTISNAQGEDTATAASQDVTINFQAAPTPSVSGIPSFTTTAPTSYADDAAAVSVDVTLNVADGDVDENQIGFSFATVPATAGVCTYASDTFANTTIEGTGNENVAATVSIIPISAGTCQITATTTEDGSSDSTTISFELPQLAPTLTITDSDSQFGSTDEYNDPTPDFLYNVAVQDIDNDGASITLTVTPNDGDGCVVDDSPYTVSHAAGATTTTPVQVRAISAGSCTLNFNARDAGAPDDASTDTRSLTLPQLSPGVDITANTPAAGALINNFVSDDGNSYATATGARSVTITDTDNDGTVVSLGFTYTGGSSTPTACEATFTDSAASGDVAISIIPMRPGTCDVTLFADEDGAARVTLTIVDGVTVPELPPIVSETARLEPEGAVVGGALTSTHGYNSFAYFFTAASSNDGDNEAVRLSVSGSGSACSASANDGLARVTITPIAVGTCGPITVTFREANSADDNFVERTIDAITLPGNFAPTATISSGSGAPGVAVPITVTVTATDPSNDLVTIGADVSGEGCTITPVTANAEVAYTGATGVGATASRTFNVLRTTEAGAGDCIVTPTASENDIAATFSPATQTVTFSATPPTISVGALASGSNNQASSAGTFTYPVTITRNDDRANDITLDYTQPSHPACRVNGDTDGSVTVLATAFDSTTRATTVDLVITWDGTAGEGADCSIPLSSISTSDGGAGTATGTELAAIFELVEQAATVVVGAETSGATSLPAESGSRFTFPITITRNDDRDSDVTLTYGNPGAGCQAAVGTDSDGTVTVDASAFDSTTRATTVNLDITYNGVAGDGTTCGIVGSSIRAEGGDSDDGISVTFTLVPQQLTLDGAEPTPAAVTETITATVTATKRDASTDTVVTFGNAELNDGQPAACPTGIAPSPVNGNNADANFDGTGILARNARTYSFTVAEEDQDAAVTCVYTVRATASSTGIALSASEATHTITVTFTEAAPNLQTFKPIITGIGEPSPTVFDAVGGTSTQRITFTLTDGDPTDDDTAVSIGYSINAPCRIDNNFDGFADTALSGTINSDGVNLGYDVPDMGIVIYGPATLTAPVTCDYTFEAIETEANSIDPLAGTVTFAPEQAPTAAVGGNGGIDTFAADEVAEVNITATKVDEDDDSVDLTLSVSSGDCTLAQTSMDNVAYLSATGGGALFETELTFNGDQAVGGSCDITGTAREGTAATVTATAATITFTAVVQEPPTIETNVAAAITVADAVTGTATGSSAIPFTVTDGDPDDDGALSVAYAITGDDCGPAASGAIDGVTYGTEFSGFSVTFTGTADAVCGWTITATETDAGTPLAGTPISGTVTFTIPTTGGGDPDDVDGDGVNNDVDVDADGDGLIEISTPTEFNNIRNNLAGTGLTETGTTDSMGCGGQEGITACSGYELANDISLGSFNNWVPIGIKGAPFNADFDGNGFTIRDIRITSNSIAGAGLFGALGANKFIRNVHITGNTITTSAQDVGSLVGYMAAGSSVVNSSARFNSITGAARTGGLVGDADGGATIRLSIAIVNTITGTISNGVRAFNMGGLVGDARDGTVQGSAAIIGTLDTGGNAGGLIGNFATDDSVHSSYAFVANAFPAAANSRTGGIAGRTDSNPTITNSYSVVPGEGLAGTGATSVASYFASDLEPPIAGDDGRTTGALQGASDQLFGTWNAASCNTATGVFSDAATSADTPTQFWTIVSGQYPVSACLPISIADQLEAIGRVTDSTATNKNPIQ